MKRIFAITFLTCASLSGLAQGWDLKKLEDINLGRNTDMDKPLNFLSNSTDYLAVGFPVGMLAVGFAKDDASLKQEGFQMATTTVMTYGLGYVLKKVVDKERPYVTHPHIQNYKEFSGGSFPSGSTALAFATSTSLSLSYPKWYVILPSTLYACTVGYSRLHLGAHYPSDVFAGAALGIGTAFASRKLNQWVRNEGKKKKLKQQMHE
jgi:membrane-associated phospholipid phosphatase